MGNILRRGICKISGNGTWKRFRGWYGRFWLGSFWYVEHFDVECVDGEHFDGKQFLMGIIFLVNVLMCANILRCGSWNFADIFVPGWCKRRNGERRRYMYVGGYNIFFQHVFSNSFFATCFFQHVFFHLFFLLLSAFAPMGTPEMEYNIPLFVGENS